jgi:hypothetical protein
MPGRKWTAFDMPLELHRQATAKAKKEGIPFKRLAINALETYVELGNIEETLIAILRLVAPSLEGVLVERIEPGTFLIRWQQDSKEEKAIVRGNEVFRPDRS